MTIKQFRPKHTLMAAQWDGTDLMVDCVLSNMVTYPNKTGNKATPHIDYVKGFPVLRAMAFSRTYNSDDADTFTLEIGDYLLLGDDLIWYGCKKDVFNMLFELVHPSEMRG